MKDSVFGMIRQVLSDSQEKVAAAKAARTDTEVEKTAEPAAPEPAEPQQFLKIAEACEFLADNLHEVVDQRTPQEKLAEYVQTQDMLRKMAEDGESNLSSEHQTQKAPADSDPPKNPSLDSGIGPGGPSSAIKTEEGGPGSGESMDAGESGQATSPHVTPKDTAPTEKANEQDASNAMNTNKEMMMPDQPEDVLKQASAIAPEYVAQLDQAVRNGEITKEAAIAHLSSELELLKMAGSQEELAAKVNYASNLLEKAASSGAPAALVLTMIRAQGDPVVTKIAEDAIYPAKISGGTEPLLQSSPGVPSALNQGSEPGENTPRETAPTTGQGSGREALSSNEAAINLTKGKAKSPQKGPLSEVLTEPAMSSAHDKVLQKSLDNASSAGVKISAAKQALKKFAEKSEANANLVKALTKMAEEGELPEEATAEEPGAEVPEEQMEAPSDEALAAAAAGVTPEMLEQAMAMQAAQEEQAAMADAAAAEEAAAAEQAAPPMEGQAPAAKAGMMPSDTSTPVQGAM